MQGFCTINRRRPDDLLYAVMQLAGHLNPVVPQVAPVNVDGRAATLGISSTLQGRIFTVGVEVRPRYVVDSLTITRAIRERCMGDVELATIDAPNQVFYGVLTDVLVELYTAIYANPIRYVEFRFRCDDPAHLDVEPYSRALSTALVACPVGNGPTSPKIYLYGGATPVVDPEIVVYNHLRDEVSRLAFTGSLGSTACIVIDTAEQSIDHYVAGVLQSGSSAGLSLLTSGSFPLVSSEDAAPEADAHPFVALEAASGTPTGLLLAQRRYS